MKPAGSLRLAALAAACLLASAGPALAGSAPAPAAPAPAGVEILGNATLLRAFLTFKTPIALTKSGELKVPLDPGGQWGPPKTPTPLPDFESAPPPADWVKADFDDSGWNRKSAPVEVPPGYASRWSQAARHTATSSSRICLRGKFLVADPAAVPELKLSLSYVGGVAVYLNGQEIARGGMPAGEIKADTLAEKYPDDLYCEPNGLYLQDIGKNQEGFNRRYRKLADVVVPAKLLVKGTNVLAVDVHRAPINEPAIDAKRVDRGGMNDVPGMWAYVGLASLSLRAASAGGALPNVERPKGIQVWNAAAFETVGSLSYGDVGDPLPVQVHAARNSVFSGRLVVSSDGPIAGLKVAVGDMKAAGGATLPASAVRVRCAEPAVAEKSWRMQWNWKHQLFDGLLEAIPASIPVARGSATAPLWFTVRVPKDAKAGKYEGAITLEAQGLAAKAVPLVVTVHDWVMPDPQDFRQHHTIRVEQESAAYHYNVPLWSDKHFEYMGKSLALLAEVNSRKVPVNLCCNYYGGNRESMVRWIKDGDGYKHDFTILDKYLDLTAKTVGKPFPLRVNCWGELDKDGKNEGCGANVTLLDPVTGKVENLPQPTLGTEESCAFWKPVVDHVLQKSSALGWKEVTAFGHNSYCYDPKPKIVSVAKKLWPDGVWMYTAHNGGCGGSWKAAEPGVSMLVKYASTVWTEGALRPRGAQALVKPRPGLWNGAARSRHWDWSPLAILRNLPEELILRGHDGGGDFGSDNFPIKDARGKFVFLPTGRGTGGGNCASTRALLAPGPDGPVATERFEMFREGTELAEAVIFLERALAEKKISGDLERKVNAFLDQRGTTFVRDWYDRGEAFREQWSIAGQAESDAQLLELAAQAAAAGAR
ncbi:MAG TPA: DUF6067 family protein [Planctomycetota bacterium]|nr:DUF6067 family protein [Planctomycetota bacterium]